MTTSGLRKNPPALMSYKVAAEYLGRNDNYLRGRTEYGFCNMTPDPSSRKDEPAYTATEYAALLGVDEAIALNELRELKRGGLAREIRASGKVIAWRLVRGARYTPAECDRFRAERKAAAARKYARKRMYFTEEDLKAANQVAVSSYRNSLRPVEPWVLERVMAIKEERQPGNGRPLNVHQIVDRLNAEGVPSPARFGRWNYFILRGVLRWFDEQAKKIEAVV
jgi:hypothetical protein